MVWVIDDVVSLGEHLATAAATDPLSAVLTALGALLVVVASAAFGVLALGGALDLVTPDAATPRERRKRS